MKNPIEEPFFFSPDVFDQGFVDAAEDDGYVAEVFRSVMGDEYTGELAPFSFVTGSVLDEMRARSRVGRHTDWD